ncbi:alanine racemase [Motilibacter aurantiacus]|uniref:alanine racemase n=1 Tax=Motilibacter aurantiacus TaxID=2714955 RepID=UPI001408930F|nr:alanine racemase [Motilibacter aurantiacus]NHC44487.1 alanine racemase [Motilibacter aurantiacus]
MSRPTLTVDLSAVAANTRLLASAARGALMAVVKADGFGHGDAGVARTALASGATALGVTSVEEALALRRDGVEAPVLSWLNPVDAPFDEAVRAGVELAVPSPAHLQAIAAAARRTGRPARLHLHVDIGMARDGASPLEWDALCAAARSAELAGDVRVVGVMGHLGWADQPCDPLNRHGRERFLEAVAAARAAGLRPGTRHLAATAATLTAPDTHFELCRVGAGLAGIDPSGTTRLHPALTLTAPVVAVREVPAGTHVGYGRTYATSRRAWLALLPVGYADGIPRAASGSAWVQLRGRRRRVVGAVSMDCVVVEAGEDPVALGETATVFGPGASGEPTTADWARWAGTLEHEIVTGIGPRVARRTLTAPQLAVSA